MQSITIYHNPHCSKSRKALELLIEQGFNPIVIEYLKNPLSIEQLTELSSHFPLEEFVRCDEAALKELGLSLNDKSQVLQAIHQEPILMQRPVVTYKNKAIIGRPPEKILQLFA
ncbi:ArsC/Spx/MgsR family protein [Legionella shakespearei]|uniref:Oxidoreductase n=1 Tax=Legionella shakespearei DSM 23087 TaxID=1122169 RepID=A0A0W0YPW6_9GAMM|nr:ArsC/Spx/MgsR family protein [Legionella shakespearei]KTD58891.1 oxidoreductase [Legionella shakespearei DSM 23087]